MTYNGWPNKLTWLTFLWLTSYEDLYMRARGQSASQLEEWLNAEAYRRLDDGDSQDDELAGLVLDLVLTAMDDIDWRRLEEALAEDTEEGIGG